MLLRLLAWSPVLTWPAGLAADELPQDEPLGGKADDLVTGALFTLLIAGLLAAGWRWSGRAVLAAALYGAAVPVVYEVVHPTVCPADVGGIDCLPVSFAAPFAALFGAVIVLAGVLLRAATRRGRPAGPSRATGRAPAAGGRRRRP